MCKPEVDRRAYYRIRYPINERPRIWLRTRAFQVVDISEGGVRFRCSRPDEFMIGVNVQAVVEFHDGAIEGVKGKILRIQNKEVVIETWQGITFSRAVKEQRRLIQKFKHLDVESYSIPTENLWRVKS